MDVLRHWDLWRLASIEAGVLVAGFIITSTAFTALALLPH